jgi:hypothetical protein
MKKTIKKIKSFFSFLLKNKKPLRINDYATSQPYLIKVENNSDEYKEYELFGASRNYLKVKDGVLNLDGVIIKNFIRNTDYNDLLLESMLNPFNVGITYVICNQMAKYLSIKQPLLYTRVEANGNYHQKSIELIQDPYQNLTDIIQTKEKYIIDGFTKLSGSIPPHTEIHFHFYPLK